MCIRDRCYTRTSRDIGTGQGKKPSIVKNEQTFRSPILPPPPSKNPVITEASTFDYLSGDAYKGEKSTNVAANPPSPPLTSLSSAPPLASESPPSSLSFQPKHNEPVQSSFQPKHNEPVQGSVSTTDHLPKAPWEPQPSSTFLPPPPAKYNQRQQFFEQQQTTSGGNSHSGLVTQTHNLSLNQGNINTAQPQAARLMDNQDASTMTKPAKPEDNLFKDLVDFAKAKSSSPTKPPGSRRTR